MVLKHLGQRLTEAYGATVSRGDPRSLSSRWWAEALFDCSLDTAHHDGGLSTEELSRKFEKWLNDQSQTTPATESPGPVVLGGAGEDPSPLMTLPDQSPDANVAPTKPPPPSYRLPDPPFLTSEQSAPFDLPLPGKWVRVKGRPGPVRLPDPIDD
jgi:hypothetical protein